MEISKVRALISEDGYFDINDICNVCFGYCFDRNQQILLLLIGVYPPYATRHLNFHLDDYYKYFVPYENYGYNITVDRNILTCIKDIDEFKRGEKYHYIRGCFNHFVGFIDKRRQI